MTTTLEQTAERTETKTIQVWPSGRGYEYQGSMHQIDRVRANDRCGGDLGTWHVPTDDERQELTYALRAEMYQDRDVLCCDSMLVDSLLGYAANGMSTSEQLEDLGAAFNLDEIRNLYPDPSEWDYADCEEWMNDHGMGIELAAEVDDDERLEWAQQAVRDNAEPAEVYEWWRVSSWLCDQLHAIGEVTIDNGYGHWWGRQCTGQAYIMDGTLQKVAALYE